MAEEVELFGSRGCPYTAELREQLQGESEAFVEYDVEAGGVALRRMLALTDGRTVPMLVKGGRVVQVGWQGRGCVVAAPHDGGPDALPSA